MSSMKSCESVRRLPFIRQEINVTIDGDLTDASRQPLSLEQFNQITGLDVDDLNVVVAVTFQKVNVAPFFWKFLKALKTVEDVSTPESLTIGLKVPVESVEYPGFFIIPYFGNYLITPDGWLIKKSTGQTIQASQGPLGYYTFRMTDDSGHCQNQLRHRILCYAFKSYPADVSDLDVNHIDGVPGNDGLENLEWTTRSGNMLHAYDHGLRSDNKPVQVRDIEAKRTLIFGSYSAAARFLGVTETTISNRVKSLGYRSFSGYQFRSHPSDEPWPEVGEEGGKYLVEFPDGNSKKCGCDEAARLAGTTRTSLLRLLREGRTQGTTLNKVIRL